jgi:pimeloyl-ACP methyl ester carboxylesterase
MAYYVQEFTHHGIGPACNFYRMGRINYLDELALSPPVAAPSLKQPTLMFTATYDDAVLPAFAKNMHKDVEHLTIREVPTSHWALWEGAKEINAVLEEWVTKVVLGGEMTLGERSGSEASKL